MKQGQIAKRQSTSLRIGYGAFRGCRDFRGRRGVVLLLTVVVLSVVAAVLAGLSNRVHRHRQASLVDLQRMQRSVVERSAVRVLTDTGPLYADRAARMYGRAKVGSLAVQLQWANENAKANLNRLHRDLGEKDLADAVDQFQDQRQAAGLDGRLSVTVNAPLKPFALRANGSAAEWPSYASWDQLVSPDRLGEALSRLFEPEVFDGLTLWGSGRIDPRFADAATLTLAFRQVLPEDQCAVLAVAFAKHDTTDARGVNEAIAEAAAELDNPELAQTIGRVLTRSPDTQTVRVVMDDGRRRDVVLVVDQRGGAVRHPLRFYW